MSDPIRILQADDEFERALLSSAESDVGSNLALKRALAAFSTAALVSTGSVAASAASASGATLTALSVAKWAGIGALVGGLGMSAASVAVHKAGGTRSPAASAQVRISATAAPRSVQRGLERETALPPPLAGEPAEPALSAPARAKVTTAPERAGGLEAELAELQPARSALNARDPDKALLLLDRFQQSFPRAALGLEASLLRLEALVASGQLESARRLSQRLLQNQPEGPYADRVRALLARADSTGQRNP